MAFSIRSFFGKDKPSEASSPGAPPPLLPKTAANGVPGNPFQPAANPFSGEMIFKTTGGSDAPGQPVASPFSPFSPANAAPERLTVGDILPLLPTDVAKNTQLAASQPLNIAEDILERALNSGRATLPLFEIYRVCPAMFQTPISPQDVRSVPLPAHKIASLLPVTAGGGSAYGEQNGYAPSPPAESAYVAGTTLFQPSPFGIAMAEAEPHTATQPFASEAGRNDFSSSGLGFGLPNAPTEGHPFQPHSMAQNGVAQPAPSPFTAPQVFTASTGAMLPPVPQPGMNGQHGSNGSAPIPLQPFAPVPAAPASSTPFSVAQTTTASPFEIAPAPATPGPVPNPFSIAPPVNLPAENGSAPTHPGAIWGQNPPSEPTTVVEPQVSPFTMPPAPASPPFPFAQMEAPLAPTAAVSFPPPAPTAAPGPESFYAKPQEAVPVWQEPASTRPTTILPPKRTVAEQPAPAAIAPMAVSPFERIQALSKSAEAPTTAASAPAAAPKPEVVTLPLAVALKGCQPGMIGISPDKIPSWVQVSLPLAIVRSQLGAAGKIVVPLADLLQGLDPEMRHLVTPAQADLRVEIAIQDLFGSPAPVEEPEAKLFATNVESSPARVPAEPEVKLPAGVPWPFAQSVEEMPTNAAPASPPPIPPLAQPPVFPPAPSLEPVAEVAPVLPTPQALVPPMMRTVERHDQLLLRVLLGTQDELDTHSIVRLTAGQPGVAAVVCLQEGLPVATYGNGTPEAENFLRQAQRIYDHVQPLVTLTGIQETETFSIKSDHQLVTFSLQGPVTLGVLHDPHRQEPTLREKVTLIARELTGLLRAA
ncbi:MAG: hypothetical protein ACOYMN_13985 [Roseimicrobium sp.]